MLIRNKITDTLPTFIGKYKIIGRLGKGGMGDIYKAIQEPLNRTVALKVLPPQLSRDDEFAKRFEIEAKAISLLQHQNIVSIFEYGEEGSYRYFAMQFVDGTDLCRYIGEHKTLPITEIIDLSKQICRGLRYAHNCSIIHRDIKPQNVLIDKGGVARLSDFGIAKIFSGTDITMTGAAVGTPEYMSPEQAQGKKLDVQTDIYSLGIVMYEMLTKRPPFIANNPMAVAYKQVHELPVPPSVKRKDTPKRLELIILKMLKKDKRERYNSIEEVLDHLDSVDPYETVDSSTNVHLHGRRHHHQHDSDVKVMETLTERRITDRRRSETSKFFLVDPEYWIKMAKNSWITWLLLGGLTFGFIYHLYKFHN